LPLAIVAQKATKQEDPTVTEIFTMNCARFLLFLVPAIALAMPAFAQVRPLTLSDSQEPGSVIVFPKFVQGTISIDGVTTSRTEIEVGVVCPNGATCPEHQAVKLRFHWVCGAVEGVNSQICRENNFDITTTVNGKVVFGPDGIPIPGSAPVTPGTPPAALCGMGYLIGWVIDTSDRPIKFDGLIGDAVIHESSTAVGAYNAIPIQADTALATGALITTATDPLTGIPSLVFDGRAGHYLAAPGTVKGDVKYSRITGTGGTFGETYLTLLTLDVRSDQPNFPTGVDFNFYTPGETLLSESLEFVCWTQVSLTQIDPNLNQTFMGRKGVFFSGPAFKFPINGIFDTAGPVTLLGLVETLEGPTAANFGSRNYFTGVFNDSNPVPTIFVPEFTRGTGP
jgi:hypothetical protein